MLASSEIEKLIRSNDIKISYTFFKNSDGIEIVQEGLKVNLEEDQSKSTKLFINNFKGDRLAITLGSIVYSHQYSTLKGRVNFEGNKNVFDLLKTQNEIEIMPGELISVCSNEFIEINSLIGGFVLPRLSLSSVGLQYFPSYVDPYWKGILRAELFNCSDKKIRLSIGEKIGYIRFYAVSGETQEGYKSNFAINNHHYANTWKSVLEDKTIPIRAGKSLTIKESNFEKFTKLLSFIVKQAHYFLAGSSIIIVITAYIGMRTTFLDFPKIREKVESNIDKIPISGSFIVEVKKGKIYAIEKKSQKREKEYIGTIWFKFDEKFIDKIEWIVSESKDEKTTNIEYTINLKSEVKRDTTFIIQYLIAD